MRALILDDLDAMRAQKRLNGREGKTQAEKLKDAMLNHGFENVLIASYEHGYGHWLEIGHRYDVIVARLDNLSGTAELQALRGHLNVNGLFDTPVLTTGVEDIMHAHREAFPYFISSGEAMDKIAKYAADLAQKKPRVLLLTDLFTIEEIHRPRQDSFAASLRKVFKKHGYDFSIIDAENDNPESIIARNHLRAVLIDIRPRSPAESIRGWFALAHDYPRLAIYRGGDRETEIFLRDEMGFKLKAENGDRTARIPRGKGAEKIYETVEKLVADR